MNKFRLILDSIQKNKFDSAAQVDGTDLWDLMFDARSMSELQEEFKSLGIAEPAVGAPKKAWEDQLARYYWKQEHPTEDFPELDEPQLIKGLKDLPPEEQEKWWNDPNVFIESKLNGLRVVARLVNPPHFYTRAKSVKTFLPGDISKAFFWLDFDYGDYVGTTLDGECISIKKQVDTTPYVRGGKGTITGGILQAAIALTSIENTKEAQIGNGLPLRYVIYDILRYKGQDVKSKPYIERRVLMQDVFTFLKEKTDKVLLNDTTNLKKREFYENEIKSGREGSVLKQANAPYEAGKRTGSQRKVKREEELDCVVTGWTPAKEGGFKKEGLVGGLEFSCKNTGDEKWYKVAAVSNIPLEFRRQISVKNEDGSFKDITKETYGKVAELQFQEWNRNAMMQHARIVRWREDSDQKNKEDCIFDRDAILEEFK